MKYNCSAKKLESSPLPLQHSIIKQAFDFISLHYLVYFMAIDFGQILYSLFTLISSLDLAPSSLAPYSPSARVLCCEGKSVALPCLRIQTRSPQCHVEPLTQPCVFSTLMTCHCPTQQLIHSLAELEDWGGSTGGLQRK